MIKTFLNKIMDYNKQDIVYSINPNTEKSWVSFSAYTMQKVIKPWRTSLYYSYDKTNWSSMTNAVEFGTTGKEIVYIGGKNSSLHNSRFLFETTAKVSVDGNAMALLNWENTDKAIPDNAFDSLFKDDKVIETVSEDFLPASAATYRCYRNMFKGCTKLKTAPALPAVKLAKNCYAGMFSGCIALEKAPDLPASNLLNQCYYWMFKGCSSLTEIHCYAQTPYTSGATGQWCKGVASTGNFYGYECKKWAIDSTNGIPKGWDAHFIRHTLTGITLTAPTWKTDVAASGGTVNSGNCNTDYVVMGHYSDGISQEISGVTFLEGSIDIPASTEITRHSAATLTLKATYELYTSSADVVVYQERYIEPPVSGSWIYFNANNKQYVNSNGKLEFSYDHTNWSAVTSEVEFGTEGKETVYMRGKNEDGLKGSGFTFGNSTAKFTVGGNVMTLLNYENTGMTMPNEAFLCLFDGAQALEAVTPDFLPATAVSYCGYRNMFLNCDSLLHAPALPAIVLSGGCYYSMFSGCKKLLAAPVLPATELAEDCYCKMFYSCNSLEQLPDLPASYIPAGAYADMFHYCNNVMDPPFINAQEFATPAASQSGCCYRMFYACVYLRQTPVLHAETLAPYCYKEMFKGCNGLSLAVCDAKDITANECTKNWLKSDYSGKGQFVGKKVANWGDGYSGIPKGWAKHLN